MSQNQPIASFRAGACSASIFENEYKRGNETFTIRNVSFQRSYMDQQGNWQNTNSLGMNDIPKAVLVLNKAYHWLTHPENQLEYTGTQGGQQSNQGNQQSNQGNQQGNQGNQQGNQGNQHMPDDDLPF